MCGERAATSKPYLQFEILNASQQTIAASNSASLRPKLHDESVILATLSNNGDYADFMRVPSIWLPRSAQPGDLIRYTCLSSSQNDAHFALADNSRLNSIHGRSMMAFQDVRCRSFPHSGAQWSVRCLLPWITCGPMCQAPRTYTHAVPALRWCSDQLTCRCDTSSNKAPNAHEQLPCDICCMASWPCPARKTLGLETTFMGLDRHSRCICRT